ncbi:MAG: HIT family protein [Chitinophagaceae bacterium]|nr:MAG: HIT family protein [Chitinophagaceae bacterium]
MDGNTKRLDCPFCNLAARQLISRNESGIAFFDAYPVSEGHALVVPHRHAAQYFELSQDEKAGLWQLVDRVVAQLELQFHPDGFNVGFNVNEAGGQTVFHTHIHIIPRYAGDVAVPRGGIRNLIPGKGDY